VLDVKAVVKVAEPVLNDLLPAMAIGFSIDVIDVNRSSDLFCDLFRVTLFRTSDSRIERLELIFFIIAGRIRRRVELISFAFVHGSQVLWGEC